MTYYKGGQGFVPKFKTDGSHLTINGSIHFKDMKLDIAKVIETMKIEDEVTRNNFTFIERINYW